jgi:hypothetical protein
LLASLEVRGDGRQSLDQLEWNRLQTVPVPEEQISAGD